MSSPKISIIIAARNTAPYIDLCLLSIQHQSFTDWECIVCDDHSDDETASVIQRFVQKDPRFKYVLSAGNRLNPALQTAYPLSTGTWINRMDSDDIMPRRKLEIMITEAECRGKGHVIAGGTQHFADKGEVADGFKRYDTWLNTVATEQRYRQDAYVECVLPSHCWLVHRDDFERVGGFKRNSYPEDYDLFFRYYQAGLRFIGLPYTLHYWRDRSERISRTWDEYKDNRYYDIKLKYFFKLDRDPNKTLAVWGAGRNGKDLVRRILSYEQDIRWFCDNENKIGHIIYDIKIESSAVLSTKQDIQLLICVSSPSGKQEIQSFLDEFMYFPVTDYFFFN